MRAEPLASVQTREGGRATRRRDDGDSAAVLFVAGFGGTLTSSPLLRGTAIAGERTAGTLAHRPRGSSVCGMAA